MSQLVRGLAMLAEQMEGWLRDPTGRGEPAQVLAVADDWHDGIGLGCTLLLRRTRFHAAAVLRANETCNVHSLGGRVPKRGVGAEASAGSCG